MIICMTPAGDWEPLRFIMDSGKEPKDSPLCERLLASNGFWELNAISFSNISSGNIFGVSICPNSPIHV